MKIAILEPLKISKDELDAHIKELEDLGHEVVAYDNKTTDSHELYERSKDADIVIIANNPYPKEVVERLEKTKYIDVAFTGVDHVAVKEAHDKGITVSNASGYAVHAVSELSVGLALSLYRKLINHDAETRKGEDFSHPYQGKEIYGKTVGIIGTGSLGISTARLYKALGAKLIGYSRSERKEALELGLKYKSLDEVMKESDIISIHLALTDETKGMISKEKMALMKKEAILLNLSRGPVIDNKGLEELLEDGKIAGAGIDVYDVEPPLPNDTPLLHTQNTVLTPHIGFSTDEAMVMRANTVFDNVKAFIEGKPQNVIK